MKFIKENYFLMIMMLFTFVYTYVDVGIRYNFFLLSLFLGIGLLSLYGLFLSVDTHPISLNKTFCLFNYFFFSIAPTTQFKHNLVFFDSVKSINDTLYIKGATLLLGILILYLILYRFLYVYFDKIKSEVQNNGKAVSKFENGILLIGISAVSVVFYLYLIKFNWDLLITRPFIFRLKYNTNLGLVGYAILSVVQLLPFVCFMYYKLRNPINDKKTYILLFMILVICFPTSLSRGILATLYIPLFLVFIPILNEKRYYIKMYLFGLLVLFPLFNNFRDVYKGSYDFNFHLFNTGHFDAFQNFVFLLDEKVVTNGRQLLGSIFFFIQESQWNNRPMGTGTLIAQKLGYNYTNVSMPFFGEGYANYGYFGILLFLIIITFFNAFLDNRYAKGRISSLLKLIFYIFLGFEFYLLRGDLYSSIKILSSFGLALLIIELLNYYNKKGAKVYE
ncbi:hypothetical protein SLW70_00500 [Flavobacterium sp. NG2]|uniref:hypothetical protein n=1 Tax=Flavobacterium sp. NG2 TaxID=3097547 RepID=UPI002A804D54|nr:hypothetical protein [Flavobacterium sp. NG2]WPR71638.1 hypothetical protein SLW70_00500 [Flavobacterium sp. NG2]